MVLVTTSITTYRENVRYLSHNHFIGYTGNLYFNGLFVSTIPDHESVIGITKDRKPLRSVDGVFSYISDDKVLTCDFSHEGRFIVGIYGDSIITNEDEEFDEMSVETVLFFRDDEQIASQIYEYEKRNSSNSDTFTVYKDKCYMIRTYAGNITMLVEVLNDFDVNVLLNPCERVYAAEDCLYAINGNTVHRLE